MKLTAAGIALRFLFALLLMLLTYNPSGHSYVHWLYHTYTNPTPYLGIAGIALIIGWVIYIKATLNALGIIGIVLASALLGCVIWLLVYLKMLSLANASGMTWVVELLIAVLLTIGICWSHISRQLTGQIDVDELDEH